MAPLGTVESERFEVAADIESWSAEAVLQWALEKFLPKVALACSFQAEESVLINMMHRLLGDGFRISTLDTGRLEKHAPSIVEGWGRGDFGRRGVGKFVANS